MIIIEVTLKSGDKAIVGLNSNFVIHEENKGCRIVDGVHNNGGWHVKDSYEEVIEKIKKTIKNKGEN